MHTAAAPPERHANSDRIAAFEHPLGHIDECVSRHRMVTSSSTLLRTVLASKKSALNGILGLALALTLGALPTFSGNIPGVKADDTFECPGIATPGLNSDSSANSETTPAPVAGDRSIIDTMLRQHAQAMSLANLALQDAADSRVRRMALRIAESHAGEIQLLRTWRSTWYPEAAPPTLSTTGPFASPAPSCTGNAFDIAFLTLLKDDVRSEISTAQLATTSADRPELRAFAASILPVRTSELRSIQSLLDDLTTPKSGD